MQNSVMASACMAFVLIAGLSGCAGLTGSTDEAAAVVEKVAPLPGGIGPEPTNVYEQLGEPSPHWVMYVAWDAFPLSRVVILDADTAELKAHVSAGNFTFPMASSDGSELYIADTMANGPERTRVDYINVYDTSDYTLKKSLEQPENRRALMGPQANSTLVDDDRFLVVFDFTPGSGLSVYDLTTLSLVSTIETPGCFLVYPTGTRGVSMLCGDGRLLTVHLNEAGGLDRKISSEPFFDPDVDPIMENGAQIGGTWYFPSWTGDVYPVDMSGEEPVFHDPWPLSGTTDSEEAAEGEEDAWLPGGPIQMTGSNELRNELFVLMHPVAYSGGEGDFGFPGTEVWAYDVATQTRIRRLALNNMAMTMYVTSDEQPLLVTSAINPELSVDTGDGAVAKMIPTVEIYDAITGEYLRRFADPSNVILSINGAPGSASMGGTR